MTMKISGYTACTTLILLTAVPLSLSDQPWRAKLSAGFGAQQRLQPPAEMDLVSGQGGDGPSPSPGPVILSDVMGKEGAINIFSGFTRDIESVAQRCEDPSRNTTVLAPGNQALMAMGRKPWEDQDDYRTLGESAYEGSNGQDRAQRNLRRFVESHLVPVSPWPEGEEVQTLSGVRLRWQQKDGKRVIQPGDVEVLSVANRVANGEIWILKDVIST
ncbi:MAG: hypothetical protein M1826_004173 [Phylliscum demangeonii]|nr:MAG: hypothetical protein M1826_004173 [Phylliscum demangeonii]